MGTLTLRYAGRRDNGKALSHVWLDENDRERWFSKFPAGVIGGIYTVDGETKDDGGMSVSTGTLAWTGEKVDAEQTAIWHALDEAARRAKGRRDAERRAGKSTELDRALEPLLDLVRACRTRDEMHAIQTVVGERITDAFYTRGARR
jgi:hypothetical protein